MTIKLSFTYTKDDHARYMRNLNAHLEAPLMGLLLILVFEALIGSSALTSSLESEGSMFLGYGIPLLLIVLLSAYELYAPEWLTRRVSSDEENGFETLWVVDPQHITIHGKHMENRFDWGAFSGLIELEDGFTFRSAAEQGTNMFYFLPKHAFVSQSELSDFRDLCIQGLGAPNTGIDGVRKPRLSMRAFWQVAAVGALGWLIILAVRIIVG